MTCGVGTARRLAERQGVTLLVLRGREREGDEALVSVLELEGEIDLLARAEPGGTACEVEARTLAGELALSVELAGAA